MFRTAFVKFLGLGFGIGIGLGLGAVFVLYNWYANRQSPPKPWNTSVLTAEFETVGTKGENNEPVFYYALANNTDFDWSISNQTQLSISIQQLYPSPTLVDATESLKIKLPFFLPARQTLRFEIHMPMSTPNKAPPDNASKEEWDDYRTELIEYLKARPFGGFVLFDPDNRYQVAFPPGWMSK